MLFLPLPWVLIEVLIFTTWTHFFDFWDVFLAYLVPSLLGAMLLARSGQSLMMTLRSGVVPGQMPGKAMLHQGARLAGAIALMIPLFLTRVLAVCLILPGLRHLSIAFFKRFIYKKIARSGGFSFVKFGGPGAGWQGPGSGPSPGAGDWSNLHTSNNERDARVVDITPIEISHSTIPSKDPGSNTNKPKSDDP